MCVQFSLLQNCPLTDWTGSLQSVNGTLTALVMFMQLVGWVGTVGLTWQTWAYPQSLITTLKNVHLFLEEARILHALLCSSFHNVITFTCDATPSSLTETNFTGCWCGIFWRGNIQWTCLAVKWEVAVVGSYFSPNEAVALVRFEACTRADVFLSGEGCLLLFSWREHTKVSGVTSGSGRSDIVCGFWILDSKLVANRS